jgi:hypothetical protein
MRASAARSASNSLGSYIPKYILREKCCYQKGKMHLKQSQGSSNVVSSPRSSTKRGQPVSLETFIPTNSTTTRTDKQKEQQFD